MNFKNRNHLKAHPTNPSSETWNAKPVKAIPLQKVSWWTQAASPSDRETFTALAHQRNREGGWTNVVAHAVNPSKAYK